jgi:hypothetical protein
MYLKGLCGNLFQSFSHAAYSDYLESFRPMAASAWTRPCHAIHPAYFGAQSHGALEKTSSHHYEQQGHCTGEVRIGTQRCKIDGVGVHDHAWGWGARAGIRRWIWASAQFSI